jgi:ribosome-associated heat shock protein Hsp15
MEEGIRIDKWLWTVRVFKTRTQATDACRAGKIRVNDKIIKPSHVAKPGETITVSIAPVNKILQILDLPVSRLSAKLVPGFMQDLTPAAEYEKLKMMREVNFEHRLRGLGRPTKRERREIEILKKKLGE